MLNVVAATDSREIVPVEEHLSSDGVREPEGRSDREDIEIVGRVT